MPAEIIRESAVDPALIQEPPGSEATPKAPAPGSLLVGGSPYSGPMVKIAERLHGEDGSGGLYEQQAGNVEAKGRALAGPMQDYARAAAQPLPVKRPDVPELQAPPSNGLHAFLMPVDNEPPEVSIQKMLTGLAVLGTGIGTGGQKSAKAALAAFTGALAGWADGDAERADRAVKDWENKTKVMLDQWALQSKAYEQALTEKNTDMAGRERAIAMIALEHDNPIAADAIRAGGMEKFMGWLGQERNHADTVMNQQLQILKSYELAKQQENLRRDLADQATQSHERIAGMLAAERAAAEGRRRDDKQEARDERRVPGTWFNRETGEAAYPTEAEIRDNPERFKATNTAGVTRKEQIEIALPMMKRLRDLAPKLLAKESPDNLMKALQLYMEGKAVSNPDLREFAALAEDVNVKMTSVMGPGQFRVTLFNVLRGIGLHTKDTQATAERILNQWETNIENDLRAITGQKLREHLAGPWQGWAMAPSGERKWIRLGKGERVEPGWITVEETK